MEKHHKPNSGSMKGRKKDYRSLEVKRNIINEMKAGATIKYLREKYNIRDTTLYAWRQKMAKIEKDASKAANPELAKFWKSRYFCLVEDGLNIWIQHQSKHGGAISYPLLQKKAKEIYANLPENFWEARLNFKASNGWVFSFLQRNEYDRRLINGKAGSVEVASADLFKEKFSDLVKGYDPRQIFTADETSLYWRHFPKTKSAINGEGINDSKERITILFCCNAVGFKLRPACVYHVNKPKAFRNIQMNTLPVWWKTNSIAFLTASLFKEWFFSEFTRQVKSYLKKENLPQKAILLIDNEPGHPNLIENCDPSIKIIFIPTNTASLLHPFSQGIIATFKRQYTSKLIQRMVAINEKLPDDLPFDLLSPFSMEPFMTQLIQDSEEILGDCNETLQYFGKEYTILKCIYDIVAAWNEITEITVRNCFGRLSSSLIPAEFRGFDNPAEKEVPMKGLIQMMQRLPGCSDASENDLFDQLVEHNTELTSKELAMLVANNVNDEDEDREKYDPSEDYKKVLDKIRSTISAIEDEDSDAGRCAFMVASLAKIEMEYQNSLMKKKNKITGEMESASQILTNEHESEPLASEEPLPCFTKTPASHILQSSD